MWITQKKYLKHNYTGELDRLIAIFDTMDEMKSFEIEYVITAANMIERSNGALKVIFKD